MIPSLSRQSEKNKGNGKIMRQKNIKHKSKRKRIIVIICLILIVAAAVCLVLREVRIRQLRSDMESHLADAVTYIEKGIFTLAQRDIADALALAERLRDSDTIDEINAQLKLIKAIALGDEHFDGGDYRAALKAYLIANDLTIYISNLDPGFINDKISVTETYIAMQNEAANFFSQGELLYSGGRYQSSIVLFQRAIELYQRLNDQERIGAASNWIDLAEQRIAELASQETPEQDDTQEGNQDDTAGQIDVETNYEHNLSISFDMKTLIDDQSRRPANQIVMGSTDGHNEGWYNGCGWVATYNALILLGTPRHPADIVNHFETSGGTVLGGVFGTYPYAIELYLRDLGYSVNHTLFPQLVMDIDEAIKASGAGILAYAHTSAAHYVAIEYRKDIDKFIVYNDSFARTMSENLGLQNETRKGAAINSVAALINNTPDILFSFSLITIIH